VSQNLIVNAAQAIGGCRRTEKGKIRISTRRDGDFVLVTVADDGPGIRADVLPRIFDPFFTTKEVGKGTGQGLAIARSVVVDKHGGTIDVESVEGAGATFQIRLPLTAPEAG
jgi:signal transduction histidine kinase